MSGYFARLVRRASGVPATAMPATGRPTVDGDGPTDPFESTALEAVWPATPPVTTRSDVPALPPRSPAPSDERPWRATTSTSEERLQPHTPAPAIDGPPVVGRHDARPSAPPAPEDVNSRRVTRRKTPVAESAEVERLLQPATRDTSVRIDTRRPTRESEPPDVGEPLPSPPTTAEASTDDTWSLNVPEPVDRRVPLASAPHLSRYAVPREPADAIADAPVESDGPRLIIGQLRVEVTAERPVAAAVPVAARRESKGSPRVVVGRGSSLHFGLGQM